MNILMLGWELPPHNSGGLGVACLQLSKALAVEGASIDFILPYSADHPGAEFMTIHGATTLPPLHHYEHGAYDTRHVSDTPSNSLRTIQEKYVAYVESHISANDSYDVVHAHDWLTMEAGIRAKEISGIPLIVHVHATEFDRSGQAYGNPLVHEIEQQGLEMADRIVAVSQATKRLIVERYNIPSEKIEVMHNALDVSELANFSYDFKTYRYLEELKQHGYTVVTNVTRFTVQKGLTHFLRAAARASEKYDRLVFLLAGDGEQRNELLELSAELGIADKVFFTGFVRGKQWRDAFSVADIFVLSSVSEPFGLSALEAAHYQNALILTKQSGVGEVLDSVLRYDFWDIDALADRLVAIASSSALKETMKTNISNEYRRITWQQVALRCVQMYRSLQPEVVR